MPGDVRWQLPWCCWSWGSCEACEVPWYGGQPGMGLQQDGQVSWFAICLRNLEKNLQLRRIILNFPRSIRHVNTARCLGTGPRAEAPKLEHCRFGFSIVILLNLLIIIVSNGLYVILWPLASFEVFSFQWRCKPAVVDGGQVQMASILVDWSLHI